MIKEKEITFAFPFREKKSEQKITLYTMVLSLEK